MSGVRDNREEPCPVCGREAVLIGVPDDPTVIATVQVVCPVCGWEGPAAGYVSPVLRDQGTYTVTIHQVLHPTNAALRLVAHDMGEGLLLVKRSLESGSVHLRPRSAVETYELSKKLAEAGVDFSISPPFEYLPGSLIV